MKRHKRTSRRRATRNQKHSLARQLISDGVHEAVCDFTGSDGVGRCVLYSIAGAVVASRVFGRSYYPQVGKFLLRTDPGSKDCWGIDSAVIDDQFLTPEIHCWFAGPLERGAELVDLTSRHYRSLYDHGICLGEKPEWKIGTMPEYVWFTDGLLPDWMLLEPDKRATELLWEQMLASKGELRELTDLATANFERKAASGRSA